MKAVLQPASFIGLFLLSGCGLTRDHSNTDGGPMADAQAAGGAAGKASTSDGGARAEGGASANGGRTGSGGNSGSGGRATGGSSSAHGGEKGGASQMGGSSLDAGGAARAALTFQTEPAPGKVCTTTNGQLSAPSAHNTSVYSELACDLSTGCKPDEYVVTDRDPGSVVVCTVAPAGMQFNVSVSLNVDGTAFNQPSMTFSAAGSVTTTGGTIAVNMSNSVAGGGGSDSSCTLTIAPPRGAIGAGKIWGEFDCSAFRDERNIGDTGCHLSGRLLFENCAH